MWYRRSRVIATVSVVALAALAGCGGAGGDAADGGETVAGQPAVTAGFDGTTIRLGAISTLTGPVAVAGTPLTAGNQVWFDHINATGGIAGRYPVELVVEDNQYKPDVTVQQYQKIKNDVVAFTQILGTPSVLAVLPQLAADGALASPASFDATWVRQENLLPVGGPYQIQAINAVDHYLRNGGSPTDTLCSMIQDDAFGEAGQQGLDHIAASRGLSYATTQRFSVGTNDHTGAIGALSSAGCDMVFLGATPSDAAKIWGAAAQVNFPGLWYGQSPSWSGSFTGLPFADYLVSNVRIALEGTEWGDPTIPGMVDMVERAGMYAPDQSPDTFFILGYNMARAMTAVLEEAVARGDLSREGMLAASNGLGTVGFDGLSGDYGYGPAADRTPPRTSTIFAVDLAKPLGLAVLEYDFTSPEAESFEIVAADL